MCGISGILTRRHEREEELRTIVDAMRDTLTHRGPDAADSWLDAGRGLGFGHRRLAIFDLSPLGRQPMASHSGRYVITFNGEVYNFAEIRKELEAGGATFRSQSDTEVMLAAFERWGVHEAVPRFIGMFAFALWDRDTHTLWLCRDRLGIKPLYFGRFPGLLAFGSELKAILAVPGVPRKLDRSVLAAYLRYNCVPGRAAIWEGIEHVLPGTLLEIRSVDEPPIEHVYWSAEEVALASRADPFQGSDSDAVSALDAVLRDAVSLRTLADVPLGAFLSGGIDSSTVVALMQAMSSRKVRTFSIGYREAAYDEANSARAVAKHLGTEHTELYVTSQDALDVIPKIPEMYDEPFSDSSQIPTYLVSALARQHVTVALSGDGGDELFGGYNRHLWAPRLQSLSRRVPSPARAIAGRLMGAVPPRRTDALFERLGPLLPPRLRFRVPGEKLHKLARAVRARDESDLYRTLCSHIDEPLSVAYAPREASSVRAALGPAAASAGLSFAEAMMLLDLRTYLPDDILTKVDRASMAVALEARVPLLDHRVVAFAWRLPLSMKVRGPVTKWVLRELLYRYVPRELVDREKSGFGVPIDQWLRGPLREWCEDLLSADRLRREGYLDPAPVRRWWEEHLSQRANRHHQLWDILVFQSWLARWG